ncbi:MAG: class III extradiol ring-cleavage dioxygenase [Gammaproteobacteria bacterium]|jgi:4,5-DOPA dioxygenase extradiol
MEYEAIFVSHGGGPMPILGDPQHKELVNSLQSLPQRLRRPDYIVVCSAHWETQKISITSAAKPELLYDYYGFPDDSYRLQYPCPGAPDLANDIADVLSQHGMEVELDEQRGLDHGVFIPLMLMYPNADIPVLQISLCESLDPNAHLQLGKALSSLSTSNILFVGSGFSFHNMRGFFSSDDRIFEANRQFEDWLTKTLCSEELTLEDREKRLLRWSAAPGARLCHPREEHLLPLHVCFGITQSRADSSIQTRVLDRFASHFIWVR